MTESFIELVFTLSIKTNLFEIDENTNNVLPLQRQISCLCFLPALEFYLIEIRTRW